MYMSAVSACARAYMNMMSVDVCMCAYMCTCVCTVYICERVHVRVFVPIYLFINTQLLSLNV